MKTINFIPILKNQDSSIFLFEGQHGDVRLYIELYEDIINNKWFRVYTSGKIYLNNLVFYLENVPNEFRLMDITTYNGIYIHPVNCTWRYTGFFNNSQFSEITEIAERQFEITDFTVSSSEITNEVYTNCTRIQFFNNESNLKIKFPNRGRKEHDITNEIWNFKYKNNEIIQTNNSNFKGTYLKEENITEYDVSTSITFEGKSCSSNELCYLVEKYIQYQLLICNCTSDYKRAIYSYNNTEFYRYKPIYNYGYVILDLNLMLSMPEEKFSTFLNNIDDLKDHGVEIENILEEQYLLREMSGHKTDMEDRYHYIRYIEYIIFFMENKYITIDELININDDIKQEVSDLKTLFNTSKYTWNTHIKSMSKRQVMSLVILLYKNNIFGSKVYQKFSSYECKNINIKHIAEIAEMIVNERNSLAHVNTPNIKVQKFNYSFIKELNYWLLLDLFDLSIELEDIANNRLPDTKEHMPLIKPTYIYNLDNNQVIRTKSK